MTKPTTNDLSAQVSLAIAFIHNALYHIRALERVTFTTRSESHLELTLGRK
jgi:hypothetical protein